MLLTSKDQPLLVWRNSFFVLDFGFHILNGVRSLNLQGYGLSSERFHKDLHSSSQSENQVESGFFLNVVIRQSSTIFKLLACKNQPLLIWGNSFFVLDFGFHVLNGVRGLDLQGYGLSSERLHKDLHSSSKSENQVESGLFLNVVIRQSSSIFKL